MICPFQSPQTTHVVLAQPWRNHCLNPEGLVQRGSAKPASTHSPRQAVNSSLVITQDHLFQSYKPVFPTEHHRRRQPEGHK